MAVLMQVEPPSRARVMEAFPVDRAAGLLACSLVPAADAASTLSHAPAQRAAEVLAAMGPAQGSAVVASMSPEAAGRAMEAQVQLASWIVPIGDWRLHPLDC